MEMVEFEFEYDCYNILNVLDLRQDMLALQFIQMIDIIWKADGLDLRFEYFLNYLNFSIHSFLVFYLMDV
jgi:hypothetical protein